MLIQEDVVPWSVGLTGQMTAKANDWVRQWYDSWAWFPLLGHRLVNSG